jgi:hypothetical protein
MKNNAQPAGLRVASKAQQQMHPFAQDMVVFAVMMFSSASEFVSAASVASAPAMKSGPAGLSLWLSE